MVAEAQVVAAVVAAAAAGNSYSINQSYNMANESTFEAWKIAVLKALENAGYRNLELDEEALYMSYDMEGKSVEEAVDEIIDSLLNHE